MAKRTEVAHDVPLSKFSYEQAMTNMATEGAPPARPDSAMVKPCMTCGIEYPKTASFYHSDKQAKDGFKATCIECRRKQRKRRNADRVAKKVEQIDNLSLGMIDSLMQTGSDVPHVAEVFQRVMEAFNGAGGFAQHFMAQYLSAKPGSAIRQRMLDSVIRLATKVSDTGAAQIPVDMLTDEDLQMELEKRAKTFLLDFPDKNNTVEPDNEQLGSKRVS